MVGARYDMTTSQVKHKSKTEQTKSANSHILSMPNMSLDHSICSPTRLPFSSHTSQQSKQAAFAKRKVSFDNHEDLDVTSRFLSLHESAYTTNMTGTIRTKEQSGGSVSRSSKTKRTAVKRRNAISSKRSLSRLSRSGCLRLLDVDVGSTTNTTCKSTVPRVSEDDMSLRSSSAIHEDIHDQNSSIPLPIPNTFNSQINSCWGHFIDFHLSDLEKNHGATGRTSKLRSFSKQARYNQYQEGRHAQASQFLNSKEIRSSINPSTEDLSAGMNMISLSADSLL